MLESLGILTVCLSSWILYERGDGWDSIFLILFSLSQLIDDQSTKLFWKCFLPSLVLCQYVFKHYSNPSSRVRGLIARGRGAGTVADAARKKQPTKPSSPASEASDTSREHFQSESAKTSPSRAGSMTSSSGNGNGNGNGKLYKGSTKLSRRVLTLACHLNVIRNTIHHPPIGARVNDELELVVHATILLFVFALPVYPGIAVIAISLMVHGSHSLFDNWDGITGMICPKVVHACDMTLRAVWDIDVQQLQCHVTRAVSSASDVLPSVSYESLAYIMPVLSRSMRSCYGIMSEYTLRLGAVMIENEECIYAVVMVCEPYLTPAIMRIFSWLGIRRRARPKIVTSASASPAPSPSPSPSP